MTPCISASSATFLLAQQGTNAKIREAKNEASIETQSEQDMAAFKTRFEKEGNQLKSRLDELSTALTAQREGAG